MKREHKWLIPMTAVGVALCCYIKWVIALDDEWRMGQWHQWH